MRWNAPYGLHDAEVKIKVGMVLRESLDGHSFAVRRPDEFRNTLELGERI